MRQYRPIRPIVLAALVCAMPASAEVYRSVDAEGNVTFTNQATEGAEPVQLKPLSVYDAPVVKPVSNNSDDDSANGQSYESVEIISPKADETVRDNPGNVTVSADTVPELDSKMGHRLQFFLDGKALGSPQVATIKTFANIDRGEHRVEVAVVDARGQEIARSKATRFFLHRQTIFNPARRGGAN